LRRLFADGVILIPFRNPVDQAGSLLRQHRKFLALHRREPFSKRYMGDIGHLEFGALHRPIRFEDGGARLDPGRADTLDYWLAYWIAAFDHILRQRTEVILLSYERACEDGARALARLADCLELELSGPFAEAASRFKAPSRHGAADEVADTALLARAQALHGDLLQHSVV